MFEYYLPNGIKLDMDSLCDAMEDSDLSHHYFLNTKTGAIESVFESSADDLDLEMETYDNRKQFIPVDKIEPYQIYEWMRDFIKELIEPENPNLAKKLSKVISGKRAFRRFKDTLQTHDDSWLDGWYAYVGDLVWEEARQWLAGLPIDIEEKMSWMDDCPLCQELKKSEESEGLKLVKDRLHKHKHH